MGLRAFPGTHVQGEEEIFRHRTANLPGAPPHRDGIVAIARQAQRRQSLHLEDLFQAQGQRQRQIFLLDPLGADRAGIIAAMAGIDDNLLQAQGDCRAVLLLLRRERRRLRGDNILMRVGNFQIQKTRQVGCHHLFRDTEFAGKEARGLLQRQGSFAITELMTPRRQKDRLRLGADPVKTLGTIPNPDEMQGGEDLTQRQKNGPIAQIDRTDQHRFFAFQLDRNSGMAGAGGAKKEGQKETEADHAERMISTRSSATRAISAKATDSLTVWTSVMPVARMTVSMPRALKILASEPPPPGRSSSWRPSRAAAATAPCTRRESAGTAMRGYSATT